MSPQRQPVQLRRVLTLPGLILSGITFVGPTAPFPIFGIASSVSKGHMAMAYLFAMAAVGLTAVSYGRMATAFPSAGSACTYVRRTPFLMVSSVLMVAGVASAVTGQAGASRLLFGMGRDRADAINFGAPIGFMSVNLSRRCQDDRCDLVRGGPDPCLCADRGLPASSERGIRGEPLVRLKFGGRLPMPSPGCEKSSPAGGSTAKPKSAVRK